MTSHRLPAGGGLLDRERPLRFRFDGRRYTGFAGDTLASALLANGVDIVGRSVKYHRPRGIFSIGSEEPNALLGIGPGGEGSPNTRATMLPLAEGTEATSQNRWPGLHFDLFAANALLGPLLAAGFYYKTFMWPRGRWMFWERSIRKMAGLGRAPSMPDEAQYEHRNAHCDVLVVGAGPAGLRAAAAAAEAGADVWLVDENTVPGGWLARERATVDGENGARWARREWRALAARENVVAKTATTAFGYYDHNLLALSEAAADGRAETIWKLRAARVVLATGAIERPQVFTGNDLPGVMLAGAARGYANAFGVLPGTRAVVAANNDSAWRTALDLHDAGAEIAAVVDCRESAAPEVAAAAEDRRIPVFMRHAVVRAAGGSRIRGVRLCDLAGGGRPRPLDCDLLAVSAGWSPAIHLHAQAGGKSSWDAALAAILPASPAQASMSAGAAAGRFGLQDCLDEGESAGAAAARLAGFEPIARRGVRGQLAGDGGELRPLPAVSGTGTRKAFVDLQNDVTVADVELAHREGYRSVEHLKRYTTLGMGTDQGKTSSLNGIVLLAGQRGERVPAVGMTTFRPPYTPVTLGAVAGPRVREHLSVIRRTALHNLHEERSALFDPNGLWLRPKCYPRRGESVEEAIAREAGTVRARCGMVDVSTLGKFEVAGPDSAAFLERIYSGAMTTLRPGRSKYGLMLREDGMIFDDGTVTCLAPDRYFLTASTSHAEHVEEHLSYLREVCWPQLQVAIACVTEAWGAIAVAGPQAPEVLERAGLLAESAARDLPALSAREAELAGVPVRLLRISFSGEWACEVYARTRSIARVWRALADAGAEPYGLEAMDVLRIEKGFIAVGAEADGRTTPADLGLAGMARKAVPFVGRSGLARVHANGATRLELVGLRARDGGEKWLREGTRLVEVAGARGPGVSIGHVTSAAWSPALGRRIGLALLSGGRARAGETVWLAAPFGGALEDVPAVVQQPPFVTGEAGGG